MADTLLELAAYAQHKHNCLHLRHMPCSCGLYELLVKLFPYKDGAPRCVLTLTRSKSHDSQ